MDMHDLEAMNYIRDPADYPDPREDTPATQLLAFRHLRHQPRSHFDASNPTAEMKAALKHIETLAEDLCDQPPTVVGQWRSTAMKGMVKFWDGIWTWISGLVQACVFENEAYTDEGIDFREKLLLNVPVLLGFPFTDANADSDTLSRRIVKNTPEFLHFVVKLWIWMMERSHPSLFNITMSMNLYLETKSPLHMANIAASVPRSISVALQRIRAIKLNTKDFSGSEVAARFLGYISKASDSFLRSLLAQGALQCMSGALRRISLLVRSSKSPENFRDIVDCTKRILLFVKYAFEREGHRVFAVLLGRGFIDAMINSSQLILFDESSYQDIPFRLSQIYYQLLKNIPPMLYFRSILNPTIRSLKRIPEDDSALDILINEKSAPSKPDSSYSRLRSLWLRFSEQALTMKGLRTEFKDQGIVSCGNNQCKLRGLSNGSGSYRRRICQGCETRLYCSEACQRDDWALNHRKACSELRGRDGLPPKGCDLDADFISWLTVHELSSRQDEINERLREIRSSGRLRGQPFTDGSVAVIVFNGNEIPFGISVKTLGEHKESAGKAGTVGKFITEDDIVRLKEHVQTGESILFHGIFAGHISIIHAVSAGTLNLPS
ncbi:hypothetical protein VKT23_002676 [Stygiomarasmius scandens]|uniref:MYND-type domain-containing protein n=1 Tax=Marasmiellus scandens TaxID=2682957 RepID=A0ABR1K2P8_9AGAR